MSPQQKAVYECIHSRPGATAETIVAMTRCYKYTNRITELRQLGINIECRPVVDRKNGKTYDGYFVVREGELPI